MSNQPTMTTKNTILAQKTETVSQPSANGMDFSNLANQGDKEPELKTATKLPDGISSGTVEVKPIKPHAMEDFMNDSIVARPLRLPNYLDVRCIDPNWIPRWVNFKTQNGSRYAQFKAAGFRNAKVEEMHGLAEELQVGGDGVIRDHDVVLMVAPKSIVYGAYKQNALNSMRMVSGPNAMKRAKEESDRVIRQGISSEGFDYGQYGKKLTSYIPDNNEMGDAGGFKK